MICKIETLHGLVLLPLFTSLQLADGHHAVIGRRLPQSQGLIVADGGTDGEEGVRGQTPDFSLIVALCKTHTHTYLYCISCKTLDRSVWLFNLIYSLTFLNMLMP